MYDHTLFILLRLRPTDTTCHFLNDSMCAHLHFMELLIIQISWRKLKAGLQGNGHDPCTFMCERKHFYAEHNI